VGADLVLMDVQMPVMDGYTATRLLRERGCKVPVIAFTANAMKGFEREIEAAGFTGYLTKPVDIDVMMTELALHLDGQRVAARAAPVTGESHAPVAEPGEPSPGSETTTHPLPAGEPVVSRLASHPRLQRVVRSFALQLPAKLQGMNEALGRSELNEVAALAHWLKGAGGTVGYDELFEPARNLEQHARSGDVVAIADALRHLQTLVQRMVIPDPVPASQATLAETSTSL
jgi:CheY-like chemotaxis protein